MPLTIDEAYEIARPHISNISIRLGWRYKRTYEEMLSRANEIFMDLYGEYNESVGTPFGHWLSLLLPSRLIGTLKRDHLIHTPRSREFISIKSIDERDDRSECVPDELVTSMLDRLSPDARTAISVVLNDQRAELDVMRGESKKPPRNRMMVHIKRHLKQVLKWNRQRISQTFAEINSLYRRRKNAQDKKPAQEECVAA